MSWNDIGMLQLRLVHGDDGSDCIKDNETVKYTLEYGKSYLLINSHVNSEQVWILAAFGNGYLQFIGGTEVSDYSRYSASFDGSSKLTLTSNGSSRGYLYELVGHKAV